MFRYKEEVEDSQEIKKEKKSFHFLKVVAYNHHHLSPQKISSEFVI